MLDFPESPMSELDESAVMLHETFLSYVNAGFTREESIKIIISLMVKELDMRNKNNE